MRILVAAGLLVFSAGTAFSGYLVELDAGDRMTVDSYRIDGERVHLMRGGVDLNVPLRIRGMAQASGGGETAVLLLVGSAEDEGSREKIEAKQRRIEHHLIRVQRERFEARSRGDAPKEVRRLDKEFKRTQQRRMDVIRELGDPPSS